MKHTFKPIGEKAFDFWGQIRKEYEEMAEKHNKAVEKANTLIVRAVQIGTSAYAITN